MHRRSLPVVLCAVVAMFVPGAAAAPAAVPERCPGAPIDPDRSITGTFGTEQQGSYVLLPFTVPRGTTEVRVKYCWDEPESPDAPQSHTLDLGIYDALAPGRRLWGRSEFRGWGGSSHPDVAITPQGFSSEADYLRDPKGYVPGRTTRGFLPGAIPPGRWAVELGVAAVIPRGEGDADGRVAWRVDIALSRDRAFAHRPYRPVAYDRRPVRRRAGWYAGDFHVHAEDSNLGAATMRETFAYAFRPAARGGAGLDFTALSDYVTTAAWGKIGTFQARYPDRLIIPSAEVITYRGHFGNQGSLRYVDYRTGPVLERRAGGTLRRLRGRTQPRTRFAAIRSHGGFTVVNHPRIFPPADAATAALCRGCYWSYSDRQTDLRRVDAIEVMNGSQALDAARTTANPFTGPAIDWWQDALAAGHHIAAVGGSDTHHAGETPEAFQSPLGRPATMVYARELSLAGIRRAVRAGHTYVKAFGVGGPDLRLTARRRDGRGKTAIMGDTIAGPVTVEARALRARGAAKRVLELQRDGRAIRRARVTGGRAVLRTAAVRPGRYGVVLRRGDIVEAVATPIWVTRSRARRSPSVTG